MNDLTNDILHSTFYIFYPKYFKSFVILISTVCIKDLDKRNLAMVVWF